MGFFNWAAPMFGKFADRWSPSDIEEIASWLRPYVDARGRLLDVGGGTGALGVKLATTLDCEVTVLDPTLEMMRYIPDNRPVHAVVGTAESMPFDNSTFDALITTDAFHHFRDQPGAVTEFARVVRCGGVVVIIELDPRPWWMRPIVVAEKLLGEPGAFFSPDDLCAFMSAHGIDGHCEVLRGVSYRFSGVVRERTD
jgi:SAM-dependent methyltransferase